MEFPGSFIQTNAMQLPATHQQHSDGNICTIIRRLCNKILAEAASTRCRAASASAGMQFINGLVGPEMNWSLVVILDGWGVDEGLL
jgi:hypothetical protein